MLSLGSTNGSGTLGLTNIPVPTNAKKLSIVFSGDVNFLGSSTED